MQGNVTPPIIEDGIDFIQEISIISMTKYGDVTT